MKQATASLKFKINCQQMIIVEFAYKFRFIINLTKIFQICGS
jgi:hypothetical protein